MIKKIFMNSNKQIRCGWKIILAFILIFMGIYLFGTLFDLLSFIVISIFGFDTLDKISSGNISSIIDLLPIYIEKLAPILVLIIMWKVMEKKSLAQLGLTNLKKDWKKFIIGLISGAVSLVIIAIILLITNSVEMENSFFNPEFSLSLIGTFILYVIVGFNEEILCRGYILSVLKQCKHTWVPYVGSAIIFALLHSANNGVSLLAYINLMLFGLFLSYVVYKTNSLWLGIGFHITWNFFEGNVFGFLVSGNDISTSIYTLQSEIYNIINGGTFGPEGGLAVTAVILLAMGLVYKFCPNSMERYNKSLL